MDTLSASPSGLRNTTPAGPPQLLLTVARGQLWLEGTGLAPLPLASRPLSDNLGVLLAVETWLEQARRATEPPATETDRAHGTAAEPGAAAPFNDPSN